MKNKRLGRAFLLSYLTSIFGGMIFGLLLVKNSVAFGIVMMVICVLDLAAIIVARNMYKRNFKVFFYLSFASFALLNVLVLAGFILEMVYVGQGIGASYAIVISSVGLAFVAGVDLFYAFGLKQIRHKRLVEEGVIKEEEDEI